MTEDYLKLPGSQDALRYIRSALSDGATLGLLASRTLSTGPEIYAFVPKRAGAAGLPAFAEGGLCEATDSRDGLISLVEHHLAAVPHATVIFEDVLARPDDAWLQTSSLRVATHENEVYYLVLAEDAGTEVVARTVARGFCARHEVAVFSDLSDLRLGSPPKLSGDDLEAIVRRARKIAVGAFDGESFLLLEKTA
jgi:hypothetical protein